MPIWFWRIAQMLALWMGVTFVGVPIMGAVGIFAFGRGANSTTSSPDVLQQMAWMPPLGVVLLWGAHRLGTIIGDAPDYSLWRLSWKRGLRTVLLPISDDKTHDFTVHIARPVAQVKAQLERLPAPKNAVFALLTQRANQPMAQVNGEIVTIVGGANAQCFWRGRIEADAENTRLTGRVESPKFGIIYLRVFNVLTLVMLSPILLVVMSAWSGVNSWNALFATGFSTAFLSFIVAYNRLHIFIERQHERAIEQFWRERFDARLELTKRTRHFLGP